MQIDVHSLARVITRTPGVRKVLKWVTSRWGEGRIYTIRTGPMKGLRWRRENRFPYWYHTGRYEPYISRWIAAQLRPGDTYWDIGAHAGYHTLQGARAVGPQGRVLAVEPDPSVCESLREQLALNALTNVTLLEGAVSDTVGSARLVVPEADDTRSSALEEAHTFGPTSVRAARIDVSTTTLDELAGRYPPAHLMKMDIEGAEAAALRGCGRLWEGDYRPRCILLSYHGQDIRDFCRTILLKHGYMVEELEHGHRLEVHARRGGTFVALDEANSPPQLPHLLPPT
jgi:FkbM family methyltransferase